ncbi:MAG: hypothetical protein ACKO38_15105, partial [Planctomycetota bacterium]
MGAERLERRLPFARDFVESLANAVFPGQLVDHFGGGVVHSVSQGASIAIPVVETTPDVDIYQFTAAVDGDVVVRFVNQGGDPEGDGAGDIGLRLQRLDGSGVPLGAPVDALTLNSGATLTMPASAGDSFFFEVSSLMPGN